MIKGVKGWDRCFWPALALFIATLLLAAEGGWGQGVLAASSPIDPLRSAEAAPGRVAYGVGLHVSPHWVSTLLRQDNGEMQTAMESRYGLALHGELGYDMHERWTLLFDVEGTTLARRPRDFPASISPEMGRSTSQAATGWTIEDGLWDTSLGVAWQVAPEHAWDPRIMLARQMGPGDGLSLQGSGRRIVDPVAVSGSFSLQRGGEAATAAGAWPSGGANPSWAIAIAGGVSFIFNDQYRGSLHAAHHVAGAGFDVPITSLKVAVGSMLPTGGEFGWELTFTDRGGRPSVHFGFAWHGTRSAAH